MELRNILRIAGLGVLAALAVYIGGEKPQMRSMRNYMAAMNWFLPANLS